MGSIANLVWETSASIGTGNLTTARNGGYQRGSEAFGTGDNGAANPYIFIVNRNASAAEWEICQAYWSDANTLVRGTPILSSNSNAAVDFGAGTKDISNDLPAALQVSLTAAQNLTNKTLTDPKIQGAVNEEIFTITDGASVELDPSEGTLQFWTLGANRTPAATNFANGESLTLMIDDGTAFTITWTTVDVNWRGGSAPTLATTGWTVIELWKMGGQIFGALVGDVAA